MRRINSSFPANFGIGTRDANGCTAYDVEVRDGEKVEVVRVMAPCALTASDRVREMADVPFQRLQRIAISAGGAKTSSFVRASFTKNVAPELELCLS